ncbi:thiamine phosphate synthase [Luethyella okanaganae]|uniref:Thiamine-phosphate synthase n=1 Tax=Luethyella okanaganae TaxID=69372 RepID=A0ABW1VGD6_9MICO
MTATTRPRRARLDLSVYLVTDAALCGRRGVLEVVRGAVAGGATVVQLRDKAASARELFDLTVAAHEVVAGRATLVVDDRVDVYLAARAAGAAVDGVHIGQGDLPVTQTRALIGPHAVLGLTANTTGQLQLVDCLPPGTVDYLGVGVIRPTATKPDHPAPLGVDGFARLTAQTGLPCVAIGGVGAGDAAALRMAGAAGIAVVSAICAADDPEAASRELREAWTAAGA